MITLNQEEIQLACKRFVKARNNRKPSRRYSDKDYNERVSQKHSQSYS
jgi:hypothetical protein